MSTFERNGLEIKEPEILDGFVVVDSYTPHTCPWDYYGSKHQREMIAVLKRAGIRGIAAETKRRRLNPVGTGPGGMVRFGDDMVASTYYVIVTVAEAGKANAAIADFRNRLNDWLHGPGPMPEELK